MPRRERDPDRHRPAQVAPGVISYDDHFQQRTPAAVNYDDDPRADPRVNPSSSFPLSSPPPRSTPAYSGPRPDYASARLSYTSPQPTYFPPPPPIGRSPPPVSRPRRPRRQDTSYTPTSVYKQVVDSYNAADEAEMEAEMAQRARDMNAMAHYDETNEDIYKLRNQRMRDDQKKVYGTAPPQKSKTQLREDDEFRYTQGPPSPTSGRRSRAPTFEYKPQHAKPRSPHHRSTYGNEDKQVPTREHTPPLRSRFEHKPLSSTQYCMPSSTPGYHDPAHRADNPFAPRPAESSSRTQVDTGPVYDSEAESEVSETQPTRKRLLDSKSCDSDKKGKGKGKGKHHDGENVISHKGKEHTKSSTQHKNDPALGTEARTSRPYGGGSGDVKGKGKAKDDIGAAGGSGSAIKEDPGLLLKKRDSRPIKLVGECLA